jgi:dTDP-4-dehydrorhamnose 3,5-epimerase
MEIIESEINGLFLIKKNAFLDLRGEFFKIYHEKEYKDYGLNTVWMEEYISTSNKNVIRGMHFQIPPYDHIKLVTCLYGEVLDVIVDLRKSSKTYGKVQSFILNNTNKLQVYIPTGCAHGFKSLKENSMMLYKVSSLYNQEADKGILYSSIDFEWDVDKPILSDRDLNHSEFSLEKIYFK